MAEGGPDGGPTGSAYPGALLRLLAGRAGEKSGKMEKDPSAAANGTLTHVIRRVSRAARAPHAAIPAASDGATAGGRRRPLKVQLPDGDVTRAGRRSVSVASRRR